MSPSKLWYGLGLVGLLIVSPHLALAKSQKAQFKTERKVLLRRIQEIRSILKRTASQKGQLKAINSQVESNAQLIRTINRELDALDGEITKKQRAMTRLAKDLFQLEREYTSMVYVGSKALHDIHQLMFILATPSFHQLVLRLQQVKQYSRIRRQHFTEITKVRVLIQTQHQKATRRKQSKKKLLKSRQAERDRLRRLRQQQERLVKRLSRQQGQLRRELAQRNRAVRRLNKLINSTVHASKKSVHKTSPRQISKTLFSRQKRQLPWPVKKGFITSRFGIMPHPVLRNVKIENLGIDIQTEPDAQVYSLYEGVVKAIAIVPGMHRVVIVQHGQYHSVYAKLGHVAVKQGQHIKAQAHLGTVATDTQGVTELQLQLWRGTQKLNPATWLQKR